MKNPRSQLRPDGEEGVSTVVEPTPGLVMTGIAFLAIGGMKSRVVDQSSWRSALETLLVGGLAATLAYAVGSLLERIV